MTTAFCYQFSECSITWGDHHVSLSLPFCY